MNKKTVLFLLCVLVLSGCVTEQGPSTTSPQATVVSSPGSSEIPTASPTINPTPKPSALPTPVQGPPSDVVYPKFDNEFTLIAGQTAVFNEGDVLFTFSNVSDSRCPQGVQCVWAGQFSVQGRLRSAGAKAEFTLIEGQKPAQVELNGKSFLVSLIEASPYPKYPNKIELSEYRVTFLIQNPKLAS